MNQYVFIVVVFFTCGNVRYILSYLNDVRNSAIDACCYIGEAYKSCVFFKGL